MVRVGTLVFFLISGEMLRNFFKDLEKSCPGARGDIEARPFVNPGSEAHVAEAAFVYLLILEVTYLKNKNKKTAFVLNLFHYK